MPYRGYTGRQTSGTGASTVLVNPKPAYRATERPVDTTAPNDPRKTRVITISTAEPVIDAVATVWAADATATGTAVLESISAVAVLTAGTATATAAPAAVMVASTIEPGQADTDGTQVDTTTTTPVEPGDAGGDGTPVHPAVAPAIEPGNADADGGPVTGRVTPAEIEWVFGGGLPTFRPKPRAPAPLPLAEISELSVNARARVDAGNAIADGTELTPLFNGLTYRRYREERELEEVIPLLLMDLI